MEQAPEEHMKEEVVELTDEELREIGGGTLPNEVQWVLDQVQL